MEELLVYALLLDENIITEEEYNQRLNERFLDNSEDEHLLHLIWETDITNARIYIKRILMIMRLIINVLAEI